MCLLSLLWFNFKAISPPQSLYSLTKYINGSSDTVAGVVCASEEFVNNLKNVNDGAAMLLGPSIDSMRSSSILKNLNTLTLRIQKHSENALYLAKALEKNKLSVHYPGLKSHPANELFKKMFNAKYGYGGIVTFDMETPEMATDLLEMMQRKGIGKLAVSLGYHKTLFCTPGSSTSSEIPEDERLSIGLTDSLVRISIGLDMDIEDTTKSILKCINTVKELVNSTSIETIK